MAFIILFFTLDFVSQRWKSTNASTCNACWSLLSYDHLLIKENVSHNIHVLFYDFHLTLHKIPCFGRQRLNTVFLTTTFHFHQISTQTNEAKFCYYTQCNFNSRNTFLHVSGYYVIRRRLVCVRRRFCKCISFWLT